MSLGVASTGVESIGNEVYDAECLKLINEYFYGVRIYPGQGKNFKIKIHELQVKH